MNSHPTHPHQDCPLVFINGRSALFKGVCSSESSTKLLQARLKHAHHIQGHHLSYPPTRAVHWWQGTYREIAAQALHSQINMLAGGFQVDVVAHSLGCDAVREIMDHSPLQIFRRVVMIAPAMERRVKWHRRRFEKMLVLHNSRDGAILAGSMLPGHPFGMAGRKGFLTANTRIRQIEIKGDAKTDWRGHSHYFREPYLTQVAGLVEDFLTDTTTKM